jgi:hypothetical protein
MFKQFANIKNRGFNETIVRNNGKKNYSKMNWDANYNGNEGNFSLDISKNGKNKHIDVHFDNQDLAQLFNIPSVNMPLEQRLKKDFLLKKKTRKNYHTHNHEPMIIEIMKQPSTSFDDSDTSSTNTTTNTTTNTNYTSLDDMFHLKGPRSIRNLTHISSPLYGEELVLPLTITQKRKRSPKTRTKRVYKVVRVPKSSKKTKSYR